MISTIRISAACVAATAVLGICLSTLNFLREYAWQIAPAVWEMSTYYTFWVNLVVFASFGTFSITKGEHWLPRFGIGQSLAMTLVLLVLYWATSGLNHFLVSGIRNMINHGILPLMVLIFWAIYGKQFTLKRWHIFAWPVLPINYVLWTLMIGQKTGKYPYGQINPLQRGYEAIFLTAIAIWASMLIIGAVVVWHNRRGK